MKRVCSGAKSLSTGNRKELCMADLFVEDPNKTARRELEGAVIFLASVIPKEDKAKIRTEIEKDPDWEYMHNFSTGMTIRNALRRGGFSFSPVFNGDAWFKALKEAVRLPIEDISLTLWDRWRLQKYHACTKGEQRMKL